MFQRVPLHIHRRNLAKRAIRTFNEDLILGLTSIDTNFPMHLWCKFLKQSEMTLNMMRESRVHPKISNYNEMYGAFNFIKTPLAPICIKVLVHEKSNLRESWATHGLDG